MYLPIGVKFIGMVQRSHMTRGRVGVELVLIDAWCAPIRWQMIRSVRQRVGVRERQRSDCDCVIVCVYVCVKLCVFVCVRAWKMYSMSVKMEISEQ